MANCNKCGFEVQPTAKFCDNCGQSIMTSEQGAQNPIGGNTQNIQTQQFNQNNTQQYGVPNQGHAYNAPNENQQYGVPTQGQANNTPSGNQPYGTPNQAQTYNNMPYNGQQNNFNQQYGANNGMNYPSDIQLPSSGYPQPMSNKKAFIILGIVGGAVLLLIFAIMLIFSMSEDPSSNNDFGIDSDVIDDGVQNEMSTEPSGIYILSSMTTMGFTMNYTDLMSAGMEMEVNFKDNGDVELSSFGEVTTAEVNHEDKTIVIGVDTLTYMKDGDNIIASGESDGIEIEFVFTHENSPNWEEIEAENSSLEDILNNGGTEGSTDFDAPGYGAVNTIPVDSLSNPSDWYGIVTISNYSGPNPEIQGEYEAYGYIGELMDGSQYFEVYVQDFYEDEYPIISCYIDLHTDTFYPIVDDEAWVMDAYMKDEDSIWYSPTLFNGILSASYDYELDEESYLLEYSLSQIGEESMSDYLAP